jgi:predicted dehydrogenase
MINIGVLGAGYLGKIHIGLIKEISGFNLVGFYDPDQDKVNEAVREFDIQSFESPEELIRASDAIDIVTTTSAHYTCAVDALRRSKHIFIEKPITYTSEEAAQLIKLTREANVVVQVGHVERFNPAFIAIRPFLRNPMFIESHRLGQFNPRGTDVPVVLDLMIHDIDIVLNIVKSSVRRISASGVPVISDTPDIANARIEFNNGCVANLTASRISLNKMRKTRIFQRDAYISIDFLNKEAEIYKINPGHKSTKGQTSPFWNPGEELPGVTIEKPEVIPSNAIKEELRCFYESIRTGNQPPVTIEDGYYALDIAQKILKMMEQTGKLS